MTTGPEQPDPAQRPQQPAWDQYGQQPPQPGYGYGQPYGYGVPQPPMHPRANTALVLGIISLAGAFTCLLPIVVGPFAWIVGAGVKRDIAASPTHYRGESEANIGMILGIIATVLLAIGVLIVGAIIVAAIASAP